MFCRRCKNSKLVSDFYGQWVPSKWCKDCVCQYNKDWRQKNPAKNKQYCLDQYLKNHPTSKRSTLIQPKPERNNQLIELALTRKYALKELAHMFGITHQRVSQLYQQKVGKDFRIYKNKKGHQE